MHMSIKQRIYLIIIIVVTISSTGLILIMTLLRDTRFERIEKKQALVEMDRVSNILEYSYDYYDTIVENYAQKNAIWEYVTKGDSTYEEENLTYEMFDILNLTFLSIYDTSGNLVYGKMRKEGDLIESESIPRHVEVDKTVYPPRGLFASEEGVQYVSIGEITNASKDNVIAGFLVMGWTIDASFFDDLSKQLNIPIEFEENLTDSILGEKIDENTFYIFDENGSDVIVTRKISSYYGEEIFRLKTTSKRFLAAQTNTIRFRLVVLSVITSAILIFLAHAFHNRWISRPLNQLIDVINNFETYTPDKLENLMKKNDEIGVLAKVFKHLKESMDEIYQDINNQVKIRTEEVTNANERLRIFEKIFENTSEGIIITDPEGDIVDANCAMSTMTGFKKSALLHENPRILKSGKHPIEFYQEMWSTLIDKGEWQGEIWDRKESGEIYPKWLNINTIRNSRGETLYYVGLATDITIIKSTEEKLNNLAYYDTLTGLANRTLFLDRLCAAIDNAERTQNQVVMLYLDLDRFKYVNDTYGHSLGDELLKSAATRILSCVRKNDTVARIGGDEYAILLEGVPGNYQIRRIANSIITILSTKYEIREKELYVGASVGIALYPKDSLTCEDLVKKADTAMYVAKNKGGNRFHFASEEIDRMEHNRLQIEAKLHNALQNNEMHLYYQPQTLTSETLASNANGLIGAEALIRWEIEPGKILGPNKFISILEETGLIVDVGRWIVLEACSEAKKWLSKGKRIQVSVNVSAVQFIKDDMYTVVRKALEETDLPSELLKIEVTESILMQNMNRVIKEMNAIKSLGVSFAIDDFGTGYSSLKYVNVLPIDAIKIDKAFIDNIRSSNSTSKIVDAMVMIAKTLNFTSIAEGVEDEEVLNILKVKGCDQIQGYYVAKPMPAKEFGEFIMKS